MTDRRPDPREDDDVLLDMLLGELDPAAQAALEARIEADPALAAARGWTESVLAAERHAFEPPMPAGVWEADAARLAARVRDEARALESPRAARRPVATRSRGWARVLAISVGAHVAVLGVIAFLLGRGEAPTPDDTARISVQAEGFVESEPDYAEHDMVARWAGIAYEDGDGLTDRLIMTEQETLADELPVEAGARAQPDPRLNDHPVGVYVPISRRKHVPTKKNRLRLLGFNAQGTMRAVEKGLRFLATEQARDGSFVAGGGRTALEQTSLAMLAFLADGHCSRHAKDDRRQGPVVRRGIAWIRKQAPGLAADAPGIGLATMALCEDYMLSYGWLSPAEAQRRATEIDGLVDRIRKVPVITEVVAPWRTWALDAAARAGVIESTRDERRLFTAWVQDASTANGTLSATSAFGALAVSTALLYLERGADKPRFLDWSRAHAEELVGRLSPIGKAKRGDPVGETASILLALQVAYRTY